jgi:hypothetical protein
VIRGLAMVLLLTGCTQPSAPPTTALSAHPAYAAPALAATCHARPPLPDPACTPGIRNPAVTQGTIGTTICHAGWTATVRPPVSYTKPLKLASIRAYGYADTDPADYEFDHYLALEDGGDPRDPRNLWAEPGASPNPKDSVESQVRRAICAGRATLAAAQAAMLTDWTTAPRVLGLSGP